MSITGPVTEPGAPRPAAPLSRPATWPLPDVVLLVAAVLVLAASAILTVRGPTQVVVPLLNWELPGSCAYRRLFGVGCPGCGLTRCFICVAHGDLWAAWHFNPTGLVMFALVAGQVPYRSWRLWCAARGLPRAPATQRQVWGVLVLLGIVVVLLLVQWFARLYLGGIP